MAFPAILAAILPTLMDVVEKAVPDKDQQSKIKGELGQELMRNSLDLQKAATNIVESEVRGESALQRNWRPITMLTFLGLIVAHWFGYTPENLSEGAIEGLFTLVQIGMGGYVVGRSAEKIAGKINLK